MTEQREAEIRERAVLIARRHVHADQASQKEQDAVDLALRREGLDDREADYFWGAYNVEEQSVRTAMAMSDADWRRAGANMAEHLFCDCAELQVRDARRPTTTTAETIRKALSESESWQRLPGRRQAEADALFVDGALAWLKQRADSTPLWQDLGAVLAHAEGRGETDRDALVRAARVAGRAVLELGNPNWSAGSNAVEHLFSGKALFQLRFQLRYDSPLVSGTSERRAAELAADALCHMLRAGEDGDLSVQVPAAWRAAHAAIVEAFDGFARSTRLSNLQLGILAELPERVRDALGIDPKIECEIRARTEQRRAG